MAIIYDKSSRIFSLDTRNTTYQMAADAHGALLHLYYGSSCSTDMRYLLDLRDRGFSGNPYDAGDDRTYSFDVLPLEYPSYGSGDYRTFAFNMKDSSGVYGADLRYVSHRITDGKYTINGLPAAYDDEGKASTLEILLEDKAAGVRVHLMYGVMYEQDVITRCASVENISGRPFTVTKAASAVLDIISGEYGLIHFHGRHGMERNVERTPIVHDVQHAGSRRGASSHQQNPFMIIADEDCSEMYGRCYGMMLLYSGNFSASAEKDQFSLTRTMTGLQDDMFEWELKPGETFETPEAAMAFSGKGLTELSHIYHEFVRHNICRGPFRDAGRPVLINNWEATEFDFTGDRIVDIAKQASELGVEMMVLDDGWFGERNSDNAGLGDWKVNEAKLGGTLKSVTERVNALGMKFGLWIEPEMINEDSSLYRTHPDWAFAVPGRKPVRGRNQLVLDFSRREIVDAVFGQIAAVIEAADVDYIKMDMNRSICDVYSAKYADVPSRQNYGRIMHEYVLGVYHLLDRLTHQFPKLLIEGCCGGGGRYDAGMMYYTPQIWLSDDTDAIERIMIQYGSSFGYPVSTVGSHVTAVPNQQTGRSTDINTRAVVAMAGSFGYELDLNLISDEEKLAVKEQIKEFKKYRKLIHEGFYYRLSDPAADREAAAWSFVAKDGCEFLLNIVSLNAHCNAPAVFVKCRGLESNAVYTDSSGYRYSGSALMEAGIQMPAEPGEYHAWQMHFTRI